MALSVAVAATGAAMGAAWVGALTRSTSRKTEVQVDLDAVAKSLGVIDCQVQGSVGKARRHVTLIGNLLVASHQPGTADAMIMLDDTWISVEVMSKVVKVISSCGSTLATFWPGSEQDTARWASTLEPERVGQAAVELLSSEQDPQELFGAELKQHFTRSPSEPWIGQSTMPQQDRMPRSHSDPFPMSQTVTLSRRQIAHLEAAVQHSPGRILELQAYAPGNLPLPK